MDIQNFLYVIALILPVYLAIRYQLHGVVLGGLVIWVLVMAVGLVNTQSLGLGWTYMILWVVFGWPVGMFYSATTSVVILFIWRMLFGRT